MRTLVVRKRRTTQKMGKIGPPSEGSSKWLISLLLLLEVYLQYIFVVAPRNHLIFELLNLMIVLILLP